MKNWLQEGKAIYLTAPTGGVKSGGGYVFGSIFGVAGADADAGETFALWLVGCFELPKVGSLEISTGDKVYWDVGEGDVNKTSSGNTLAGVAIADAASDATTVNVRLNGSF